MKPATTSQRFARPLSMGWDGLAMLALSNVVLLLTAGFSGAWMIYQVWQMARTTLCTADTVSEWVMVLGVRLRQGQIRRDYEHRLHRAAQLYQQNPQQRILLVGGYTGGDISEAERGRRYLLDAGIPASALLIEDRSLHTLENLRNVRALLGTPQNGSFVLVTNRYHLARSQALAQGLGLQPILCAAEDRWQPTLAMLGRIGLEAYYLHWYAVGKAWSQWTRNRHQLARIT